ncbi:T9SS type B sorting domain-containing protein [Flavobacterium davisii]|uniref:T9SS type B sorting domain-containing protein n=1 Tax=Flavobacterium columnare TaxID=996 RepID=A0A8G0P471_9FLAO|nr:T9SS type B sorting domain-containing protein [Flavobacterium davisii]QYS88545.1 T9SS type B sorting domain-containing protein [Flavobacterium davisii]
MYKNYITKVTKYKPYLVLEYSDAFEIPSFIKVTVLGNGSNNYSYQLDNGNYQDSNIFYNVSSGEHSIASKDNLGHCSPAPIIISIINHPKFFTPNGDGYNDYWNIPDLLKSNPTASIQIFDRYEKLIQRFSPNSKGWDGTSEGIPLPADDYWFTVEYNEKNSTKIFKSHFSLKR